MNQSKKTILAFMGGVFLTLLITLPLRSFVLAEQSGDTPNSGTTSYIKQIYDSLVSLGNGSDSSGSWGNWGNMWNRIRSSSEWVPSGDATAGDVVSGKTFYGDDRSQITGTLIIPESVDYSKQSLKDYDNDIFSYDESYYKEEESAWTNTATDVWKDERTGLYWSGDLGDSSNIFPNRPNHSDCDFFVTNPRSDYSGGDNDCGNAINLCAELSKDLDGDSNPETNWYLPTQKELLQAYIDGMEEKTGYIWTTWNGFWSSTEWTGNAGSAIVVYYDGSSWSESKTTGTNNIRCVARD